MMMKPAGLFRSALALSVFVMSPLAARAETIWKPYGFLLPSWMGATKGVESFSQPNSGAFTAAGNPALRRGDQDGNSSFQVAQSRLGVTVETSPTVAGTLEVDFIDFTKASPTTAANPRLRRAFVDWKAGEQWMVRFGQDWDLISPLAPHTYNVVGHYFESGDIGFMRLQLTALHRHGEWEEGFALGFPAQNSTAAAGANELSIAPTLSFRETWSPKAGTRAGLSFLLASIRASATDPSRLLAGAITLFGEHALSDSLNLVSEAYVGQNTYNLGLLGLGYGNLAHPRVREAGGYVTAQLRVGEATRLFGGVGAAFVLTPSRMEASYARPAGTAALAGTGPGIERNLTARLGVDHALGAGLTAFAEASLLATRHHLIAADWSVLDPNPVAEVVNLGLMLKF